VVVMVSGRRALSTATLRLYYEVKHGDGPWVENAPAASVVQKVKDMQNEVKRSLSRIMQQEF